MIVYHFDIRVNRQFLHNNTQPPADDWVLYARASCAIKIVI